jgi:hypothetical protein
MPQGHEHVLRQTQVRPPRPVPNGAGLPAAGRLLVPSDDPLFPPSQPLLMPCLGLAVAGLKTLLLMMLGLD